MYSQSRRSLIHNSRGIGIADAMLLLAAVLGVCTFYLPQLLRPEVNLEYKAKVMQDLASLASAIGKLETDTQTLAGYPGPNSCLNNMEFADLSQCRLGLRCQDGKYSNWKGPYLLNFPKDPWGRRYYMDNDFYQHGKTVRVIGSFGPNGVQDYGVASDDVVLILCGDGGKT